MKVYILESHIGLMNHIVFRGVFASLELAESNIPDNIRKPQAVRKYKNGDLRIYYAGNMNSDTIIFTVKETEVING